MAKETDSNKKLPNPPTVDTDNKPINRIEVVQNADGKGSIVYAPFEKDEIEQYSFEEHWTPMGSFKTRASHEKKELVTRFNYETRDYNKGGHSSTHETHVESYIKDTRKVTVEGDSSKEVGRNNYEVTAGQKLASSLNATVENSAAGDDSPTYRLSSGDLIEEHTGSHFEVLKGDLIQNVTKNRHTTVQEGDYGCHVQAGNYDVQVVSGKLHLMTLGDDLIANSNVKVILQVGPISKTTMEPSKIESQVGALSKITMDPSSIKLQVGGGSYIEITAGRIRMVSPRIDLN